MAMRITTSMVQRNVLADLNNISAKLTQDADEVGLGQGDHPPVRRPVRHRAGDGAAPEPERQPAAPAQRRGRDRLAGRDRAGADGHHRVGREGQEPARPGRHRLARPDVARRDRRRARADHRGHQADRQHELPRLVPVRRHRDRHAAVPADEHAVRPGRRRLPGRRRGLEPGGPRHRPRDRPGRADDDQRRRPSSSSATARAPATTSCSTSCATRSTTCAPATRAALRGTDLDSPRARTSTSCSRSAPPTAPRPTAWRPPSAGLASSRSP